MVERERVRTDKMKNNDNPQSAVSSQSLLLDIQHATIFINTEAMGEMDPFVEM